MHDDDVLRGQLNAGIDAGKTRIAPIRDLAEEDVRKDVGREPQRLRDLGQGVGGHDSTEDGRDMQHVPFDGRDRRVGHRRVRRAEIHRAVGELPDAAARADRLVVQLHVAMRLIVRQHPV